MGCGDSKTVKVQENKPSSPSRSVARRSTDGERSLQSLSVIPSASQSERKRSIQRETAPPISPISRHSEKLRSQVEEIRNDDAELASLGKFPCSFPNHAWPIRGVCSGRSPRQWNYCSRPCSVSSRLWWQPLQEWQITRIVTISEGDFTNNASQIQEVLIASGSIFSSVCIHATSWRNLRLSILQTLPRSENQRRG